MRHCNNYGNTYLTVKLLTNLFDAWIVTLKMIIQVSNKEGPFASDGTGHKLASLWVFGLPNKMMHLINSIITV